MSHLTHLGTNTKGLVLRDNNIIFNSLTHGAINRFYTLTPSGELITSHLPEKDPHKKPYLSKVTNSNRRCFLNTSPVGASEANDPGTKVNIQRGEWTSMLSPSAPHTYKYIQYTNVNIVLIQPDNSSHAQYHLNIQTHEKPLDSSFT